MTAERVNLAKYFLPYQEARIEDEHPHVLGRKCRRAGWTYAEAFKHTRRRVRQCEAGLARLDQWFTSQDYDTAKEYVRYVAHWLGLYQAVERHVRTDEEVLRLDDGSEVKTAYAEFPNGARITALSANPNAIHGRGGDVTLDEHAYHKQGHRMYAEAGPCIRWGGGQMSVFSNPDAEGTCFDQLCGQARTELAMPPETRLWSYHEVNLLDAVAQGLVEKVWALKRPATPEERADFIRTCRAECLSQEDWLRLYMCTSASAAGAYLPLETIAACESPQARLSTPWGEDLAAEGLVAVLGGGSVYVGIDIGRSHDLTVAWAVRRLGDVLWTTDVRIYQNAPFRVQREGLLDLARRSRAGRIAVDAGGIGMQLAEELAEALGEGRVESVHLGTAVQEALAARMRARFEDRTIRIPSDPDVRDDLRSVRRVALAGGGVRRRGGPLGAARPRRLSEARLVSVRAKLAGAVDWVTRALAGERPEVGVAFDRADMARWGIKPYYGDDLLKSKALRLSVYRDMLRDPVVKAGYLGRVFAVCATDWDLQVELVDLATAPAGVFKEAIADCDKEIVVGLTGATAARPRISSPSNGYRPAPRHGQLRQGRAGGLLRGPRRIHRLHRRGPRSFAALGRPASGRGAVQPDAAPRVRLVQTGDMDRPLHRRLLAQGDEGGDV